VDIGPILHSQYGFSWSFSLIGRFEAKVQLLRRWVEMRAKEKPPGFTEGPVHRKLLSAVHLLIRPPLMQLLGDQEAKAAASDEMIAATLGIFSACGDWRSQPALSHDSGTENSE
jgi:hypothetical protein